ncbi:MAG TPA: hypothetical protein VI957_00480 [Candidatus Paceibacterota bacterium]
MKKIYALIIGLVLSAPLGVSAASFVITPSTGTYAAGSIITVSISVNPESSTVYTAMLDVRFPVGVFEVISFKMNDVLLPITQSGYDTVDNSNGILTKTGGYTGGLSSTALFGTLMLRAKSAGAGTLAVVDSSKLLDSNNVDLQSGTQSVSFIIAAKTPSVQTTNTIIPATSTSTKKGTTTVVSTTTSGGDTLTSTSTEAPNESGQLAAVGAVGTGSSIPLWVWFMLLAVVIVGAGWWGYRRFSRTK